MSATPSRPKGSTEKSIQISNRFNRRLTSLLKILLLLGVGLEALQGNWLAAFATVGVLVVASLPVALGQQFDVRIPPEFELSAVLFVYASLFLGEVQGYYAKFWWWDLLLHTGSGLMLGIFGFVLVYVMNEKPGIELSLKPSFIALFAFAFAVSIGALWEILEFLIDQAFGTTMQKNGIVDTMSDLIVDCLGALTISILGYGYLKTAGGESFLERWIHHFIVVNQRFFRNNEPRSRP